jgi:nitrous oxidase accessory protein NosD
MQIRWGTRSIALALLAGVLGAAQLPAAADARRTIDVFPGRSAIQKAVARADAGDTVLVHRGTYTGQVKITKPIKLQGSAARGARPVIDGRCRTSYSVEIESPGVVVRHFSVIGAASGFASFPSAVNFRATASGRAQDLVVRNTCRTAEYGINVLIGGQLQIIGNRATGFTDSGIYVGTIKDTHGGALNVQGNEAFGNSRGIIIEFSNDVDIRVLNNYMHDNKLRGEGESPPSGLLIMGSRGILIQGNRSNHHGSYGIDFRSQSRNNRLFGNNFGSNPLAVHLTGDAGPNCGTGNLPNPFSAC